LIGHRTVGGSTARAIRPRPPRGILRPGRGSASRVLRERPEKGV
jgi:hypothetical protein